MALRLNVEQPNSGAFGYGQLFVAQYNQTKESETMLSIRCYNTAMFVLLQLWIYSGCSPVSVPSVSEENNAAVNKLNENRSIPPAPLTNKVTLGDPTLTAGIVGTGKLTIEQIKSWLKKPGIHDVLIISLPQGIDQASAQITGLKKNPMTRAKIELGRQLFFDPRLSADNTISCSSCHGPREDWARHTRFGIGIRDQKGTRNTPVLYNRILSGAQFWDGRAVSVEAQAVGPITNPVEMGNTHEAIVKTIAAIEGYKIQFDAIFGKNQVTIDSIGKALATFEITIVTGPSPYDYYVDVNQHLKANAILTDADILHFKEKNPVNYTKYLGLKKISDAHPISISAIRGMKLFFSKKTNCFECHAGANFTDEKYHNLGVGVDSEKPDLGRYTVTKKDEDLGAFKTPTIRNVEYSAPYMHDGSLKRLEDVVAWYVTGGGANTHLSKKIKKLELTKQDKADLVAFMKACTGDFPKVETGRLPE